MKQRVDSEYWQLVWEKFKAGDREAFETIYNEFVDLLFAYGSRITSNQVLLEDAIQDVFIDAYTYGNSLRHPEYLEYYLFKTLKRNIIRKIKESRRFDLSEESQSEFKLKFPIEESYSEDFQLEKHLQILQQEIEKLDAGKRELLFLKFNSGLTYVEIGQLLNVKPDTVKKQVRRMLKYFKKHIKKSVVELFLICCKA